MSWRDELSPLQRSFLKMVDERMLMGLKVDEPVASIPAELAALILVLSSRLDQKERFQPMIDSDRAKMTELQNEYIRLTTEVDVTYREFQRASYVQSFDKWGELVTHGMRLCSFLLTYDKFMLSLFAYATNDPERVMLGIQVPESGSGPSPFNPPTSQEARPFA